MKTRITTAQYLAIAAGIAATGTSQLLNVESVSMQAGASNGEYASVIAAGMFAAVGLAFASAAWSSNKRLIAIMLTIAWGLAFGLDGHKTWERKQFTANARIKATNDHNAPIMRAKDAMIEAKKMAQRAHQAVLAETEKGGCGKICKAKTKLWNDGQAKLANARTFLANQPALIALDNRGNPHQAKLDAAWAIFLSLTASLLLAFGFSRPTATVSQATKERETIVATQIETPARRTALDPDDALDFILRRCDRNGGQVPECVNDLALLIGWSTGRTSEMTTKWANAGLIRKEKSGRRSVITMH